MENLKNGTVFHERLQVWRVIFSPFEFNQMNIAIPRAELDQTKPVAPDPQPHGFRVNCDAVAKRKAGRQIAMMEMDGWFFGHSVIFLLYQHQRSSGAVRYLCSIRLSDQATG